MKSVGIIGYKGFVGRSLFHSVSNRNEFHVTGIDRAGFQNLRLKAPYFDYLIHAGNPAKRFAANSNPQLDFLETVEKTEEIIQKFSFGRLILISSLSCRTSPETVYGRNRLLCEELVQEAGSSACLRLGPMFGEGRTQDTLHDLVAGKNIFYSSDTRYSYASVNWVCEYICNNLEHFENGDLQEIGASNWITLEEISQTIQSSSIFLGGNDDQITEGFSDGPDAHKVLDFAKKIQLKTRL